MIMKSWLYIILLMLLMSCVNDNSRNKLSYDLPHEVGNWVCVKDSSNVSMYCVVDGEVYAGCIDSDEHSTLYSFFRESKSHFPPVINVDVESFQVNINEDNEPYARDKNNVYYPNLSSTIFFLMEKLKEVRCTSEIFL